MRQRGKRAKKLTKFFGNVAVDYEKPLEDENHPPNSYIILDKE